MKSGAKVQPFFETGKVFFVFFIPNYITYWYTARISLKFFIVHALHSRTNHPVATHFFVFLGGRHIINDYYKRTIIGRASYAPQGLVSAWICAIPVAPISTIAIKTDNNLFIGWIFLLILWFLAIWTKTYYSLVLRKGTKAIKNANFFGAVT